MFIEGLSWESNWRDREASGILSVSAPECVIENCSFPPLVESNCSFKEVPLVEPGRTCMGERFGTLFDGLGGSSCTASICNLSYLERLLLDFCEV